MPSGSGKAQSRKISSCGAILEWTEGDAERPRLFRQWHIESRELQTMLAGQARKIGVGDIAMR